MNLNFLWYGIPYKLNVTHKKFKFKLYVIIVHIWRYQVGQKGSVKFWYILSFWSKSSLLCIFRLTLYVNDPSLIQFTFDESNSEGDKLISMVHTKIIVRDSKRISIGRWVRLIKCPYSGLSSVRLMSIPVIKIKKCILLK